MDSYLIRAFEELYTEDGLAVIGRGLGILALLAKFLRAYSAGKDTPDPSSGGESNPRRLVFCLNAGGMETALCDYLIKDGVPPSMLPGVITNKQNLQTRRLLYAQGGCYFTTARIMIVDLLTEKILPKHICGILLYNAHRITETSIEAFILKIFKSGNPEGFVKAFSDAPEDLQVPLVQLERILRNLQVKRLYLYPRFQMLISHVLQRVQPEVIELTQPMSPRMVHIQNAILVALEACLGELKRSLPQLDASHFTIDNGIFKSFDMKLRALLEPEWHKLSWKIKNLVTDLTTIRNLFDFLLRYDAITFYSHLMALKQAAMDTITRSGSTKQGGSNQQSLWLTTVAADEIFRHSWDRIFESVSIEEPLGGLEKKFSLTHRLILVVETPPKWQLLGEILDELVDDMTNSPVAWGEFSVPGRVVVIVRDEYTARVLAEHLSDRDDSQNSSTSGVQQRLMLFVTQQCDKIRKQLKNMKGGGPKGSSASQSKSNADAAARASSSLDDSQITRLSAQQKMLLALEERLYLSLDNSSSSASNTPGAEAENKSKTSTDIFSRAKRARSSIEGVTFDGMREMGDETQGSVLELPSSSVAPTSKRSSESSSNDRNASSSMFSRDQFHVMILTHQEIRSKVHAIVDLCPSAVVLLDTDLLTIRLLETHAATTKSVIKVYFVVYDESIEQHRYNGVISREKKAFEGLISSKAHMVIPTDINPKMSEKITDSRPLSNPYGLGELDSRMNDGVGTASSSTSMFGISTAQPSLGVIVDVREFRSSLPFLLYSAGLKLIPVTLIVGDYVLSPQICVERKGISDLFQSFQSGRLYNQAEMMARHYAHTCLLIEFDPTKAFGFMSANEIAPEIQINSIISKLSLLILAFPNLRLLWSRGPAITTDIFKELKKNREDVDLARALAAGNVDAAIGADDDGTDEGATSITSSTAPSSSSGAAAFGQTMNEDDAYKAALDMLKQMPGIDDKNIRAVIDSIDCIADLADMTEQQLVPLVGPVNAKKLYLFLNRSFD